MKLSTKRFKERYPYWIPFAKAFFLFVECEYNSIFEVSAVLKDNTHICSYFALYPDIYGFPFDRLLSCLIRQYSYSEFKSDLSNFVSFIHSLNDKQFDCFLDELSNSHNLHSEFMSFITDKFHEAKS